MALKFSPFPLTVQRKELRSARDLYQKVVRSMEKGNPRLLELCCEKVDEKKVTLLVEEILAVQMYEQNAAMGGSKRPGFSFDA